MPTIPAGIKPVVQSYGQDAPGGVMRTEVAGGAPRYALDWDRGVQRHSVTLILNEQQFAAWTVFFLHQIKKGALSFEMQLDSGFGAQMHTVNIVPGSYAANRTDGIMTVVTFTAEAESKAYAMSASDADAYLEFFNDYGLYGPSVLDRLARFATVDSNVLDFP